jgi:hypothetical protein
MSGTHDQLQMERLVFFSEVVFESRVWTLRPVTL